MTTVPQSQGSFEGIGIEPRLLSLLATLGFTAPTPIQHQAIPVAVEGKDVIGIAQTGTGKTLAFGVPMVQRLKKGEHGLIILPTRELASQVDETLRKIGGPLGLKTAVFIGGVSMRPQMSAIRARPDIVIATPGRLLDHMQQGTITLKGVKILVLDEADRMLDMGFAPQINRILKEVPADRQTLLFSATMPQDIVRIARSHMKMPVRIEMAPAGTAAATVEQEVIMVGKPEKLPLLLSLLQEHQGTVLVFSRTKHGAKKITKSLRDAGVGAAEIHANRSQNQRKEALDGFKSGRYRVLVATDIASRGIDVKNIELVVNFDLPDNPEDYVHRIGRTGRAGMQGKAIAFATPDQRGDLQVIERLIRNSLRRRALPGNLPPAPAFVPDADDRRQRRGPRRPPHGHRGRGGGRGYRR